MRNYISKMKKNEQSFLIDSKFDLNDAKIKKDLPVFESIGLATIVTVYCNPGGKFSMISFISTLEKLIISFATLLKLYNTLQIWRLELIKLN